MTNQLNNRLFWVLAGASFIALIANLPNLVSEIDQKLDMWVYQAMVYQEYDTSAVLPDGETGLETVSIASARDSRAARGHAGVRDQAAADQIMRLFVILKAEGHSPNTAALGAALLQ